MIDFKERPELGWNALLGVSFVAIVVLGWFVLQKPVEPKLAQEHQRDMAKASLAIETANKGAADLLHPVRDQTWDMSLEALGSQTLDRLSHIADATHVQLSDFRSERTVNVGILKEAPFLVILEGSFTDVVSFMKKIEQSDSKLAVNMLQVTTSDAGGGRVTATLGLVAFLMKEAS